MTGEIIAQHDQAVELRQLAGGVPNPDSVATIAWLGYEAPGMNLDVTDDAMAKAGAGPLNHFLQGIGATSNVPDQDLTAFGHSYGSLTTSLALQEGGAPVDNVVLYGSPGGELSNASQLGVRAWTRLLHGRRDRWGPHDDRQQGLVRAAVERGARIHRVVGELRCRSARALW